MTEVTPNLPHCGSFCKYCFMKPLHSEAHAFLLFLFLFIFQRLLGEMSIEELDEGAKGDDDNTHHHADDVPC